MTALDEFMPQVSAGSGAELTASLSLQIGRLADAVAAQERDRQRLAHAIRYASIQPQQGVPAAGAVTITSQEMWGPKTGYFWAVQSIRVNGLADSASDNQAGAAGTITAGAGTASLPAGSTLTGFTATFSAATSSGTITVSNVNGGPFTYSIPSGATSFTQSYGAGLEDSSATSGPAVTAAGLGTAAGNIAVYGTTGAYNVDNVSIYRGPAGFTQPQNFMYELNPQNPTWKPGRTEFILQPGDWVTVSGTGLASPLITVAFDVVIGELGMLGYFLL